MPKSFIVKTLAQFQGRYIFDLIASCLYVSTSVSISFKVLKCGSVSHEVCAWVIGTRDQTPERDRGWFWWLRKTSETNQCQYKQYDAIAKFEFKNMCWQSISILSDWLVIRTMVAKKQTICYKAGIQIAMQSTENVCKKWSIGAQLPRRPFWVYRQITVWGLEEYT